MNDELNKKDKEIITEIVKEVEKELQPSTSSQEDVV